jgi:hypothetical protein
MKVFIAGATGVLGRRVVEALLSRGIDVTGVAREPSKHADLAARGARLVTLDLFDAKAVRAAVTGHDVVCNLATAIPLGARAGDPSAWEDNDRIRREGGRGALGAGTVDRRAGHRRRQAARRRGARPGGLSESQAVRQTCRAETPAERGRRIAKQAPVGRTSTHQE